MADTEKLWRLEREWHKETMDPSRRTDVYKKLPEWTNAHLTAARTKYRVARGVGPISTPVEALGSRFAWGADEVVGVEAVERLRSWQGHSVGR